MRGSSVRRRKSGEKNQPASQTDYRADSIASAIAASASAPSTSTSTALPVRGGAAPSAQPPAGAVERWLAESREPSAVVVDHEPLDQRAGAVVERRATGSHGRGYPRAPPAYAPELRPRAGARSRAVPGRGPPGRR